MAIKKNEEKLQHQVQETNVAEAAHLKAEKDIAADPDFKHDKKTEDLDEGELARLGGDNNDLA